MSDDPEKLTIDRFEDGELAVLETATGHTLSLPRRWLPEAVAEGDVLGLTVSEERAGERTLVFSLDAEAAARRREEARELRARLPEGPEGDIDL